MRTSKTQSTQRASFVIDIFTKNAQTSISEVRRKLLAEFKHSMSYALITKYRDAVIKEAKAAAHVAGIPSATPKMANGHPIVTVLSPSVSSEQNGGLPPELVDAMKHLVRFGLREKAGLIQISATREGEVNVNCLLEQNAPTM